MTLPIISKESYKRVMLKEDFYQVYISTDYFKADLQTASAVGHLENTRPVDVKGCY